MVKWLNGEWMDGGKLEVTAQWLSLKRPVDGHNLAPRAPKAMDAMHNFDTNQMGPSVQRGRISFGGFCAAVTQIAWRLRGFFGGGATLPTRLSVLTRQTGFRWLHFARPPRPSATFDTALRRKLLRGLIKRLKSQTG